MSAPEIIFKDDARGRGRLFKQLGILAMPPVERRRLLRKMGGEVRKDLRGNIQRQQNVDGSKMAPRADRRKRRMFRRMGTGTVTQVQNENQAIVTWKHAGQAKTASRHHHGISEEFTAARAAKQYGKPDYKAAATKDQARALNQEGFRRRVARKKGKGKAVLKRVPQKWITENMTIGQAGMILRLMRTGKLKGKQRWEIPVPERQILGATEADAKHYLTAMANTALQQIQRA